MIESLDAFEVEVSVVEAVLVCAVARAVVLVVSVTVGCRWAEFNAISLIMPSVFEWRSFNCRWRSFKLRCHHITANAADTIGVPTIGRAIPYGGRDEDGLGGR